MPSDTPIPYEIDDYKKIIADWVDLGLKDFFKNDDIKKSILYQLECIGCKPLLSHFVYKFMSSLIELVGSLAFERGGQAIFVTACKWSAFRHMVDWLHEIIGKSRDKEEIKRQLLASIANPDYQIEMTPSALSDLDTLSILRDEKNHQRLISELGIHKEDFTALIRDLPSTLNTPFVRDPRIAQTDTDTPFQSLYFGRQYDDFQGRNLDHDFLKSFLNDETETWADTAFRWQLVYGEGGMGKSRLALELLHTPSDLWRGGFVVSASLDKININLWRPTTHTLLIIDYAATNPERIGQLIVALRDTSKDYGFKVRLLLLERSAHDEWMRKMRNVEFGALIDTAQYKTPYELTSIEDDDLINLVKRRLHKHNITTIVTDAALNQKIYEIDPKGRPLFAAIIAEALIDGQALNSLKRQDLLLETLSRERDKHWLKTGEDHTSRDYIRHANLMCLATLTFGIVFHDLDDSLIETLGLPRKNMLHDQPFDKNRMARMGGYIADTKEVAPLEPDLLGELFALNWLEEMENDERQAMIDAAWRLDPQNMAGFMVRAARDYGDLMIRLKALQPSDSRHDLSLAYTYTSVNAIAFSTNIKLSHLISESTRKLCNIHTVDSSMRLQAARGVHNLIMINGRAGNIEETRNLFAYLKTLSATYPNESALRMQVSKIAVNLMIYEENLCYFTEVNDLFEYIKELSEANPTEPILREYAALAATNLLFDEFKRRSHAEANDLFAYIKSLNETYPNEAALREQVAVAIVSLIVHEFRAGNLEVARTLFQHIKDLTEAHLDEIILREHVVKVAYIMITFEGEAANIEQVKDLHGYLLSLGREFLEECWQRGWGRPFSKFEDYLRTQKWI